MHSIEFNKEIGIGTVQRIIFDACRANQKREPRDIAGFSVSFTTLASGTEHEAAMRDTTGEVVGLAIVDQFDA